MMTPKTLSNVFARRVVENPRHSIFFVGYADPASPAGILQEAQAGDEVILDPEQPPQRIACKLERFQFSAHASRESLIDYAMKLSPKKVVLVHGDPPAVEWMRSSLAAALPKTEMIVPMPGKEIEL
jgi:Cft2 family RNA processing exonuclease